MKEEKKASKENNPETGTNNVFRKSPLPEEAGDQSGTPLNSGQFKDKGDLGKEGSMQEQFRSGEGHRTMDDDESAEGPGGRIPGDEPGVR